MGDEVVVPEIKAKPCKKEIAAQNSCRGDFERNNEGQHRFVKADHPTPLTIVLSATPDRQ